MDRTACTETQCLHNGALYLNFSLSAGHPVTVYVYLFRFFLVFLPLLSFLPSFLQKLLYNAVSKPDITNPISLSSYFCAQDIPSLLESAKHVPHYAE